MMKLPYDALANFSALPIPKFVWVGMGLVALLLVAAASLWLSFILVRRVWRIRWISIAERQYLHLRNDGNLPVTLQVSVISPDGQLNFAYGLDGAALTATTSRYVREERLARTAPLVEHSTGPDHPQIDRAAAPSAAAKITAPGAAPAPTKGPSGSAAKQAGAAYTAAQGKATAVIGISSLFAQILSTIGSLLPGSAGRAFSQMASNIRGTTSTAARTVQAPVEKAQQAQNLRGQVSALQTEVKGQAPARSSASPGAQEAQAAAAPQPGEEPAQAETQILLQSETFPCQVVQLPALHPESALTVELSIEPRNRHRRGEYTYWLLTQSVDPTNSPADPQKMTRRVKVQRLPRIYWWTSFVLSLFIVIFNASWAAVLAFWLVLLLRTV